MNSVARIAAIGVNHWHALYDAAYLLMLKAMPDVEIVALHDDDEARARERVEKLALSTPPKVYTDYKRMLDDARPDFVLALGKPTDMASTAHYLLDNGFPFVMEKPMGYNAEEVRGIADKARAVKGFATVSLPYRFQPQTVLAQQLIADGRLGTLSHINIRQMRPTSARYPAWGAPWMLDPKIANGGCLRNLGPHGLDVFMLLTGCDAEVTGAQFSNRALGQPVEDYASVMLRAVNGITGILEVSNLHPNMSGLADFSVSGSQGLFYVSGGVAKLITTEREEPVTLASKGQGSMQVLREAITRWREGRPPFTSVEDCYRVVRLIDRAYALA
jgi:predicted dehydrogenase